MSKLVFSDTSGIIYILWDMTKILINLDCWTSHTSYRNFITNQSSIKRVVLILPFIAEGITVLLLSKYKFFLLAFYRIKMYRLQIKNRQFCHTTKEAETFCQISAI